MSDNKDTNSLKQLLHEKLRMKQIGRLSKDARRNMKNSLKDNLRKNPADIAAKQKLLNELEMLEEQETINEMNRTIPDY